MLKKKVKSPKSRAMRGCPQLKAVIVKVYSTNPRKPNSANRKVAKVEVGGCRGVISAIKGVPNNLKKYSRVWLSGVGFRDTPGVNTKLLVGKESFTAPAYRATKRSLYAVKRPMWIIAKLVMLVTVFSVLNPRFFYFAVLLLKFFFLSLL